MAIHKACVFGLDLARVARVRRRTGGIAGTVCDATGAPLSEARVVVAGTQSGALTERWPPPDRGRAAWHLHRARDGERKPFVTNPINPRKHASRPTEATRPVSCGRGRGWVGGALGSALGLCLAAASAAPAQGAPSPGTQRPNIVLIMADHLGFSDIGAYGGEVNTPDLDRLAGEGLRFTEFYNAARCSPTRASLLTGLHPHQAGMRHMPDGYAQRVRETFNSPSYTNHLAHHTPTIAEVLRGPGFATSVTGKWHLGYARPQWPADRGFECSFALIPGAMRKPIERERLLELEWRDSRWLYLQRYGLLPKTAQQVTAFVAGDGEFSTFAPGKPELLPIPLVEVDFNRSIEQDPRY